MLEREGQHTSGSELRKRGVARKKARLIDRPSLDLARPAGFEPTTPWFVAKFFGRKLLKSRCFFAVMPVANCMTVQNRALLTSAKVRRGFRCCDEHRANRVR
jgi:hypothetical protein